MSDIRNMTSPPISHDMSQAGINEATRGMSLTNEISQSNDAKYETEASDFERRKTEEGIARFKRLGWKRLTMLMIVQAIALGALSLPTAFATLGMFLGVFFCLFIGMIAIYTAYIVGQVKLRYPHIAHYPDAGRLMFGKKGYEIVGAMLVIQLLFLTASHCLTGTIAFINITGSSFCSLIWGAISAIILLLLAVPPSFAEIAILGYIDFASIILAIAITIIATGTQSDSGRDPMSEWSAWPKEGTTYAQSIIAICNIFFAYSFCLSQFSFMDEMRNPHDYMKAIYTLGGIEIFIYTITGALIYSFVGIDVKSPALLSAGSTVSKVAFGVAIPVIFISGSINTTVAARYVHGRYYQDSITRFVNTTKGWVTWLALITVFTVIGFIIAEAIPFFNDLVAIASSLLNSGFTLYLPALMYFMLLKGTTFEHLYWRCGVLVNIAIFVLGLMVLVGGTYAVIVDIVDQYEKGKVRGAFHQMSFLHNGRESNRDEMKQSPPQQSEIRDQKCE